MPTRRGPFAVPGDVMIVEATNYFALPGRAAEVLDQRRHATALRLALGLPAGRILVRIEGGGPDVRWECEFPDPASYERDRQARSGSAEFEAAKNAMHKLLARFERHVHEVVADQG